MLRFCRRFFFRLLRGLGFCRDPELRFSGFQNVICKFPLSAPWKGLPVLWCQPVFRLVSLPNSALHIAGDQLRDFYLKTSSGAKQHTNCVSSVLFNGIAPFSVS